MFLIVGLGNPGVEYEQTNHNVGFRVVDEVAKIYGGKFGKKPDCDSLTCKFKANGEEIVLAKPTTYMNCSGLAVKGLVKKYKVDVKSELIVISDDFDIKEGTIRIRQISGASSHNGIKSVKNELNTNEFIRIKVSIGAKPAYMDTATFVLDKVKNSNTHISEKKAVEAICDLINGELLEKVSAKYSN